MEEEKDKGIEENREEKVKPKKSFIKKLFKVLLYIILGLVGLNVLLYVLLSIPWVQQKVVDFAIDQVKAKTKTEMSIREVRLSLFNNVNLKGIYLEDQAKDTLLYAESLGAKLDLWQLIRNNTLTIKGIDLDDAIVNVSQKDIDSPFNFQFLIDAFAGDTTAVDTTSSSLKIDIRDIKIKNSRLRYDILSEPDTINTFDPSHIRITDLNAELSLPSIDMEDFKGEIESLSFKEKSGFELKNVKTNVYSKGDEFYTDGFVLTLPQSELNVESAKYNLETDEFALVTKGSKVHPMDVVAFMPSLKFLTNPLDLRTSIKGKLPEITVDSLVVSYGDKTFLRANAFIGDYSHYDTADLSLSIDKFTSTSADIGSFAKVGDSTFVLPDMLKLLGDIQLKGYINGKFDNLKIDAEALTKQGGLTLTGKGSTDTTFQNFTADMTLHTQNFNLRPFVGDSLGIGRLSAAASIKLRQTQKQSLSVDAKGLINSLGFRDYTFRQVPFTAYYSESKMGGWLDADLPIGYVKGEVEIQMGKEDKYVADLVVRDFHVAEFYTQPNWHDPRLSLNLKGNLQGEDINTLLGDVVIDSLVFRDSTNFVFEPGTITLNAGKNNSGRYIALRSSICDANISGNYNFLTLYDDVADIMHPFLPDFFEVNNSKTKRVKTNNFRIDAFIDNTEILAKILDLPLVLHEPLQIHTAVNAEAQRIDANVNAPDFAYNTIALKSTNIEFSCDSAFYMNASTQYVQGQGTIGLDLDAKTNADTLVTLLTVNDNNSGIPINGQVNALAHFDRPAKGELISYVRLLPTDLKVDSLNLSVLPASIKYEKEKIYIDHFGFNLENAPFLVVDGVVSDHDSLNVFFNQANIGTILEAVNIQNIKATVNGNILANNVLGDNLEVFTKDFSVSDIMVFGDTLGNLHVDSDWSSVKNAIKLGLSLDNPYKGTKSTIDGYVYPSADSLDLKMNIDQLALGWIQPFVSDFLNKMSGSLSAGLDIKGKTTAPITNGWFALNDAVFGVAYTNVAYHVTDSISVSPDKIGFDYLILSDDLGNYGLASATVTHQNFQNFQYNLDMHLYNLMVLDTEDRTDSLFYGKVFASGDVKIKGNDDKIDINMNVMNSRNSQINILMPQTSDASDYKSIVFINTPVDSTAVKVEPEEPLPIKVGVGLDIDPRINIRVIINPLTGDEMYVTGNGHIDFNYDLVSERMTTYGDFFINNGKVRMKVQVKTFEFDIQQGGVLRFSGDPLKTQFNITAYHRVKNADLKLLDPNFASDATLTTSKVNADCVLKIEGNMDQMKLTYDVNLPDAPDDVKRKVDGLISTDEQKIRQFASLLVSGSFYSSESGGGNIGNALLMSVASTTLSQGLNAVLGSVLGDKWQIGTNISSSDGTFNDMDMSVNISRTFLDDKLKFSTDLGYRTEQTSADNSFIGDFDVEYELSQNWKLKGYNHTNEKLYRQAPTTQGIGIVYTKEAKVLKELFRFFGKKKKKQVTEQEK